MKSQKQSKTKEMANSKVVRVSSLIIIHKLSRLFLENISEFLTAFSCTALLERLNHLQSQSNEGRKASGKFISGNGNINNDKTLTLSKMPNQLRLAFYKAVFVSQVSFSYFPLNHYKILSRGRMSWFKDEHYLIGFSKSKQDIVTCF